MKEVEKQENNWTICKQCQGRGKINKGLSKKSKEKYLKALNQFENANKKGLAPIRPTSHLYSCIKCNGSGLIHSKKSTQVDLKNMPHVAIIGAGIGGLALAVACLHRGIPFTLYERDADFNSRSQGYGLTLQQSNKAIKGLGVFSLEDGVISSKHIVHTPNGKIIGEWGNRKWMPAETKSEPKKSNIHIARQSLRLALLKQLGGHQTVQWGHQLLEYSETEDNKVELAFEIKDDIKKVKADLLVGADGIRSIVRKILIGEEATPLRYLGCIVILGICPLKKLNHLDSPLLDSKTVFQTANGKERIYIMPYDSTSVMWQLSIPMEEKEAKKLSNLGALYLKKEACKRAKWHEPIPKILAATEENMISGYPVYDRELLRTELLQKGKNTTLIGDAAHPMSPFKGQGANQAILDALSLAREILKSCNPPNKWKSAGIRKSVLNEFETEMLKRSAVKVKDSADAVKFLHSEMVLYKGDEPRGRAPKK
ncbi:FAD-dependent oxidoreductase [Flavobacterium sp.]|uniref:FAD-dependent oxidoreductase n=1 Tax=Flavobacterium sp. TaxID=239 RepID=UPI003D28E9CF